MSNAVANIKQEVAAVGSALEKMKPQLLAALPRHITPERLIRVALVAVQQTPKLLQCDRHSLYLSIMRAAQLGLEPDGILGQAYLIPFGNQVQFIPGYKGLIDLARRSGEVSNIIAKEVCANDEFKVDFSLDMPFIHRPLLKGDRGEVTHFWALAKFKDGGFHWDYMTKQEVMAIRDKSSGWQQAQRYAKDGVINSPWANHFVEMGKKTAIRRIAKYLPMSVQRAAAFEAMQDAGHKVDFKDGDLVIEETIDQNTGEIITQQTQPAIVSKLDEFANTAELEAATEQAVIAADMAEAEVESPSITTLAEIAAMPEKTARDLEVKAAAAIKLIETGTEKAAVMAAIAAPVLIKRLKDLGRGVIADKLLNA